MCAGYKIKVVQIKFVFNLVLREFVSLASRQKPRDAHATLLRANCFSRTARAKALTKLERFEEEL